MDPRRTRQPGALERPSGGDLDGAALAILEEMRPLARGPSSLVFPGAVHGRPLSDTSLSAVVRGTSCDGLAPGEPPRWRDGEGRAVVPHGFRATFKDRERAHGFADHLSELTLAHVDKDEVRAAHARADLLKERRPMMEARARFCIDGAARPSDPRDEIDAPSKRDAPARRHPPGAGQHGASVHDEARF